MITSIIEKRLAASLDMKGCRHKMHTTFLLLCIFVACIDAVPVEIRQIDKKPFTFDDILTGRFYFGGFNGSWISDDEILFRRGDLQKYRMSDGNIQIFLESNVYNNWRSPSFTYSTDYSQVLVRFNETNVFRHSIVAQYDIYNIADRTITNIGGGELLNFCVLSPNGNVVAFVRDNNIFVQTISDGNEVQLTNDGIDGVVYNGVPDWVYEEEVLGSGGALWFSPDGNKIAIASFDDTNVEEFTYVLYGDQYEKEESLRYPKAGRVNPTVSFRYIDLSDVSSSWYTFVAPEKVTADHVLYSVNWINDELVAAFWLNRRQNLGSYQICSTSGNRNCYEGFELHEPNGWVDISTPRCTSSGNRCFFVGYGNGQWRNVHRYDLSSPAEPPVAMFPNNFTVLSLNGFSDDGSDIYFTSTLPGQPHTRHIFKNDECLSCGIVGPEEELCDYASGSFSKSFTYFAFTCSGPRPSYTKIYRTSDKADLLTWEENPVNRGVLEDYQRPQVLFENVPVVDGFLAAVKLTLPPEIDLNSPQTDIKYPMVVEVYGGPDSVEITGSFSVGFKDYQVTSRKIIHCRIDGRGSGNKGKDLLFTINNKMGTVEIEDQITVTKYLQQKYRFIDETRTGIWGWSYGGYATAMVLSKDVENVFKCGISVAPVSGWIYYDSIYTERYMGLPILDDNLVNYNATDVNLHIDALKNHEFLLMHGNADDNVHFQNTMVLTKALVSADVQFEQASYPNEAHSLGGVQRHAYHTIDQFWTKCFKLDA